MKELLKAVHICQSCSKNKSGTFLWTAVCNNKPVKKEVWLSSENSGRQSRSATTVCTAVKHLLFFAFATVRCYHVLSEYCFVCVISVILSFSFVCMKFLYFIVAVRAFILFRGVNVWLQTRLADVGVRAFPVAIARAWKSLPVTVTSWPSLITFRQRLNTKFFAYIFLQHCFVCKHSV